MFIIGNILVVKTICVAANTMLNKPLFVIGNILLQSFDYRQYAQYSLVLWETYRFSSTVRFLNSVESYEVAIFSE